jgi:hypothetical protein
VLSSIAEAVRVDVLCANGLDRRKQLKWKEQDVNQPAAPLNPKKSRRSERPGRALIGWTPP